MSQASANPDPGSILVAGASGTIGRAVVRELVARGASVAAMLRKETEAPSELEGAQVCRINLADTGALKTEIARHRIRTVISCIASRSGSPKDAEHVDFLANLALLKAAEAGRAEHFILLSAICVQRPLLAFQHAKIAFERALRASQIDHTIVRPTAFFKSLSGQVERVRNGKPFLLFGDGELTRCKPISDADLARFIADCASDPEMRGAILPIGGPGPAITPREQGEELFRAAGREPRFRSVPVAMFSAASAVLSLGARYSEWCAEKAEYARIARYYATESMLVLDPAIWEYSDEATPEFGSETLADHYRALLAERV
ncbi:MAG: NAD(P)H-binding protein [Erythrobacter sp.]